MRIIDVTKDIEKLYKNGVFDLGLWESYMQSALPAAAPLCLDDMQDGMAIGLSWENDYLPVLNGLRAQPELAAAARRSFEKITHGLERKIKDRFGRTPDADIILYPGLCNGAGWVTELNSKTAVLLGIEKIVELRWCGVDDMTGLIYHELGHVYQKQFGVLERDLNEPEQSFLWQLFTEGIAMVFEQELVGGAEYFHQDKDGWKAWCDANEQRIARAFMRDLPAMTDANQRYFGDWVSFEGHPDTGYYLGARFVRSILKHADFDAIISLDIAAVQSAYSDYLRDLE